MRIACLVTNNDFTAFARARPDDGEKFATLFSEVRPDWTCTPFWVCKNEFPQDLAGFEGVVISGSPASTSDKHAWIGQLESVVQAVIDRKQPLFGVCFGHQLIAKTLGSRIIRNPEGWGHGLSPVHRETRMPWSGPADDLRLYASHIEQVEAPPRAASVTFSGPGLPVAGFAIGTHVATIQHHPEMTHQFIADLIEEYADDVGPDVTARARASLVATADRGAFAEEMARFFEMAGG